MLDAWLDDGKPVVVHFNCGLHDLKFGKKTEKHPGAARRVREEPEARSSERLKKATPHVVFANTTPIIDDRHAARKADFDRFDKDVKAYNERAVKVMLELGIPVDDLNRIVQDGKPAEMLGKDGTHYTAAGYERLADAVADCVKRQLRLRNPTVLKAPASGPEAVKAYQEAEAANDKLVPDAFKNMKVPEFAIPATKADWEKQRPDVKEKVVASLGDLPPRPAKPKVHLVSVEIRQGFTLERLRIDNGVDGVMSAMMLIPEKLDRTGSDNTLAALVELRPHAIAPAEHERRRGTARSHVRQARVGRIRSGRGVVRRPRGARSSRQPRDDPRADGQPSQVPPLVRPHAVGHVRSRRSGRARLPLLAARKWT